MYNWWESGECNWKNITAVFCANAVRLYVDGNIVQQSMTNNYTPGPIFSLEDTDLKIIGSVQFGTQFCDVRIDEFRVWSRALSSLEVIERIGENIDINLNNIGVTIDFAHILYSNEQPALVAALIDKHSKILGLHLNDGYGKRDDGLMVGSVHQLATIELLYHITKLKYQGPIYFDTFPDTTNMDPIKECELNIDTVRKQLKLVDKLIQNNELTTAIENQDSITSHKIFNSILYS